MLDFSGRMSYRKERAFDGLLGKQEVKGGDSTGR